MKARFVLIPLVALTAIYLYSQRFEVDWEFNYGSFETRKTLVLPPVKIVLKEGLAPFAPSDGKSAPKVGNWHVIGMVRGWFVEVHAIGQAQSVWLEMSRLSDMLKHMGVDETLRNRYMHEYSLRLIEGKNREKDLHDTVADIYLSLSETGPDLWTEEHRSRLMEFAGEWDGRVSDPPSSSVCSNSVSDLKPMCMTNVCFTIALEKLLSSYGYWTNTNKTKSVIVDFGGTPVPCVDELFIPLDERFDAALCRLARQFGLDFKETSLHYELSCVASGNGGATSAMTTNTPPSGTPWPSRAP